MVPGMSWTRGEPLTDVHRERLIAAGLEPEVLAGLEFSEITGPLPEWWHEGGNALYLRDGFRLDERLIELLGFYPFSDALIVVATDITSMQALLVGGDSPTIFIGPDTSMVWGELYCGGGSAVILSGGLVATSRAQIDARNGGSIVAGRDQLWAANVYIATDDMHRLEDGETGQRINPYGANIRFGEHVWLGRDVIVTGHAEIGDGAVVGMRAMVRNQKVEPRTAVAGVPARLIRENVVWSGEDTP
jgi:acetyltransferase-like isoleucine patch superfamily enzyme